MKFIYAVAFVFFSISIGAQDISKFGGFIKIQDSLFIKYRIEFTEKNGAISGISFTDFGGEHETMSKIAGTYSEDDKLISFSEVQMIYTKSPVSLDNFDFCNVHFQPSKFKIGSDKLSGDFKGKFKDGSKCLDGEIAMSSYDKINQRVSKFSKKVEKSRRIPDSIKNKVRDIKIIDTLNLNILKPNDITSIPTKSKSLKFEIYDGGQIDGDIISIYQDGKLILSKHKISATKETFEIPVLKRKTQLKIVSESVGSIGANTAIIEVLDNGNIIKTMTNLNKGESTLIDVIKI
ncbi:hypothetical protein Q2T40_11855 [Winogradskyella maritima]|uniref:Uncharacterized protein n=1 Tax=Winogradskyella maritima TaxID=1517766 RepID=A0ABV8AJH5_9FLAO|nr:hypothetical protein [Winogradskyella maritima]